MADTKETTPPLPAAEKSPKEWQYVGPGSKGRESEQMPLISNLPLDLKQPRLGTIGTKYRAEELPVKYIQYVMDTVSGAKNWWR